MDKVRLSQSAILLFKEVFEKSISLDNFLYKHYHNPDKMDPPISYYCWNEQIVGMYGCMRQKVQVGSRQMFGVYCCDVAISPKHKNGVYFELLNKVLDRCKNEASYLVMQRPSPVHCRILDFIGFHYIGNVFTMELQVSNMEKILSDSCIGKISIHKECPFTVKEFDDISKAFHTGVCRTADYYKWKVDNNSFREMKYVICRRDNNLEGFFIIEIDKSTLKVVDWIILNNSNSSCFSDLLKFCLSEYPDIEDIKIKCVSDQNGEKQRLEEIGFWKTKQHRVYYLKIDQEIQLEAEQWMMRELDEDGMLQNLH